MRRLRPEGVGIGGLKAPAWLGLLIGAGLALASCATRSANETYGPAAHIIERTERESASTPSVAAYQALGACNEPVRGSSASASLGSICAFLSGLLGAPPETPSAEADTLIARAIAEHEMRNP